jgi:GxxExxY protein
MTENQLATIIVDACYKIHTGLDPGLLETVYEVILQKELQKRGLSVVRQVPAPIVWDGVTFEEGFRADLIINDQVIIELKSVEKLAPVHGKQLLTYLRLMNMRLGLLVNSGDTLMKNGVKRVVNGLEEGSRQDAKTARGNKP